MSIDGMKTFAYWGPGEGPRLDEFREVLAREWERRGYVHVDDDDPNAAVVFNFINPDKPKPFRSRQRSTYVAAVHALYDPPDDVLKFEYPCLVRSLTNLGMLVVPGDACYFVTP